MNDRVRRVHCSNGFREFDSHTTTNIQTKYDQYWIIYMNKINKIMPNVKNLKMKIEVLEKRIARMGKGYKKVMHNYWVKNYQMEIKIIKEQISWIENK